MADNGQLYLIDTCVLVNIRDKHGDSEEIWKAVRNRIKDGSLKTTRHVWDELERRFSDIFLRVKDLRKVFLVPDEELYGLEVIAEIRAIQLNHGTLIDGLGAGNPADPFLIAVGKSKSAIVVTDEKVNGPGHKSKIPYVCKNRNVGCTSGPEYLKVIGFNV